MRPIGVTYVIGVVCQLAICLAGPTDSAVFEAAVLPAEVSVASRSSYFHVKFRLTTLAFHQEGDCSAVVQRPSWQEQCAWAREYCPEGWGLDCRFHQLTRKLWVCLSSDKLSTADAVIPYISLFYCQAKSFGWFGAGIFLVRLLGTDINYCLMESVRTGIVELLITCSYMLI